MKPVTLLLRVTTSAVSIGLLLTPAASQAEVLRGGTDQSQPVSLRLTHGQRELRFNIVVLLTRCHGPGWRYNDSGAPRAVVLRGPRSLRVDPSGRARTTYSVRRHPHHMVDGSLNDLRWTSRITFRASLGHGGGASGVVRFQTEVREIIDDTESINRSHFRCDTGVRRWRMPGLSFSGPWRPTRAMNTPRTSALPVTLRDGQTLLAGGYGRSGATASTELYDPSLNRWRRAGRLHTARSDAATVSLPDGRAIIAGGAGPRGVPLKSVEVYDPSRRAWTAAPDMRFAHRAPATALLADGRVLVAGGFRPGGPTASLEIFDPATSTWSSGASLPGPTGASSNGGNRPSAALVPSGRVLVVDGAPTSQRGTYAVYDPATDSWTSREPIPGFNPGSEGIPARLAQLSDGSVLAVASCDIGSVAPAALYTAGGWRAVASAPHCGGSLTALPSGRALIARAEGASVYDPPTDRWLRAPKYFFPHPETSTSNTSEITIAPAPHGALLLSRGLNRFSSAERLFEP